MHFSLIFLLRICVNCIDEVVVLTRKLNCDLTCWYIQSVSQNRYFYLLLLVFLLWRHQNVSPVCYIFMFIFSGIFQMCMLYSLIWILYVYRLVLGLMFALFVWYLPVMRLPDGHFPMYFYILLFFSSAIHQVFTNFCYCIIAPCKK